MTHEEIDKMPIALALGYVQDSDLYLRDIFINNNLFENINGRI